MSIGPGLRSFLLADSTVSALVDTRCYPVQLPQNTVLTSIRYSHISGNRPHSSPQGALGLSGPRIQIDAWAPTYAEAMALAEAIRKRLDGYRGPAGSQQVQGAFFANERDDYSPDAKLYVVSRDYFVWFEESID